MIAKPEVLKWARVRAGLTENELAQRLDLEPDRVLQWEEDGELTIKDAQRLAKTTHTPYGYLFLPSPPSDALPITDFRTIDSAGTSTSINLIDAIYEAQSKQDWYREFLILNGEQPLDFVGSITLRTDTKEAANTIRSRLKIGFEMGKRAGGFETVLREHFKACEEAGILIMRSGSVGGVASRKIPVSEFRGFALADKIAPMIVINSNDSMAAQFFTLVHEIAHIWLGQSAVSNLKQTFVADVAVEKYCNEVAAEILVPIGEIRALWKHDNDLQAEVRRLAGRVFKVSTLVVCRRAYDAGLLTREEFDSIYEDEQLRFIRRPRPRPVGKSSGPTVYVTVPARIGQTLTRAIVSSARSGGTSYRDAMRLLGVANINTFHELSRRLGHQVP